MKKLLSILLTLSILLPLTAQAAMTDNIYSYYKFDGNSNDATAGARNLTNTSVSNSTSNGIINQGNNYNGSAKSVLSSFGLNPSSFNTGLSVSGWFRPTNTNFGFPFNISGGSFGDIQIGFSGSGTSISYMFGGTAGAHGTHSTGGSYSANTWYHIVITHNGTVDKIYKNGTLISTDTGVTLTGDGSSGIGIGAGTDGGNAFTGDIDEVGIWTRELSAADVTALYNTGVGFQYPFSSASPFNFGNWFAF